jgi:hypothetical protein
MQSAVTGFTKALETEPGRKLFDRYSNSATLTFDGSNYGAAGSCRRRLDRWSDVADLDFHDFTEHRTNSRCMEQSRTHIDVEEERVDHLVGSAGLEPATRPL